MYWTGSDWIELDQIGSDWIKLDRPGSDWIGLDQSGSGWIGLDQLVQRCETHKPADVFYITSHLEFMRHYKICFDFFNARDNFKLFKLRCRNWQINEDQIKVYYPLWRKLDLDFQCQSAGAPLGIGDPLNVNTQLGPCLRIQEVLTEELRVEK